MTNDTTTVLVEDPFQQYRRSQIAELRPYVEGEDISHVAISPEDAKAGSPKLGDMIARNPSNHDDQWLVSADYFAANFETMDSAKPWERGTRQYRAPSNLFLAAEVDLIPDDESRTLELHLAIGRHISGLASLTRLCGYLNRRWWEDPLTGVRIERNFGELIALMHSELSEALEGHRKDRMDDKIPTRPGAEVELADCLIRILDTADHMGMDIAGAWAEKSLFNMRRIDHTHAARLQQGGKKY